MKKGIHPQYYPEAKVICACGNTWTTGSTKEEIHTEMCSACHPFFTGEQRIVDTAGQVDRFQRRKGISDKLAEETARRRLEKGKKKEESLFEFVSEARPTAQETLQAEFPEVAQQVAAAEAKAAAEKAAPAEKPRRAARPPRGRKPRPAGEKKERREKADKEPEPAAGAKA